MNDGWYGHASMFCHRWNDGGKKNNGVAVIPKVYIAVIPSHASALSTAPFSWKKKSLRRHCCRRDFRRRAFDKMMIS